MRKTAFLREFLLYKKKTHNQTTKQIELPKKKNQSWYETEFLISSSDKVEVK